MEFTNRKSHPPQQLLQQHEILFPRQNQFSWRLGYRLWKLQSQHCKTASQPATRPTGLFTAFHIVHAKMHFAAHI